MKLIVYGDFNCPYSCLASARVDNLLERELAEIDWRAVEHDPSLPTPSQDDDGSIAAVLDSEVAEVRGLVRPGENFPIRRPPVQPNTAAAVSAFAASSPDEAHDLRRRLFAALWFDGRDISAHSVLDELGVAPEAGRHPLARAWGDEWLSFDRRVVPMVVLPDGYASRGLGALARLADLAS